MTTPSSPTSFRSSNLVWRTGLAVAVLVLAGNLLIFVIARALGSPLATQMAGRVTIEVEVGQIIPFSVFPVALGTLLLWAVHRRGPRTWTVLAAVGAVVALLSVLGPLTLAATPGSLVVLAAMHVLTGTVWTLLVLRGGRMARKLADTAA